MQTQKDIYTPFKYLTTKIRRSKRDVELEMAEILRSIIQLRGNCHQMQKDQLLQKLKQSKSRMKQLQQKLNADSIDQTQILGVCKKKVHIDVIPQSNETQKKQKEKENIFNSQVIHLLSCRKKLKEAKNIVKYLPDGNFLKIIVDLYEKAFFIRESIAKNQLRPLKQWCYDHSHSLMKIKSSLQFKLISCEYINILNNGSQQKAIQFLRKSVRTMNLSDKEHQDLNKLTFMLLNVADDNIEYYTGQVEEEPIENTFQMINDKIDEEEKKQRKKKSGKNESEANDNETKNLMEAGAHIVEGAMRIIQILANQNQQEDQQLVRMQVSSNQQYQDDYEEMSEQEPVRVEEQPMQVEQQREMWDANQKNQQQKLKENVFAIFNSKELEQIDDNQKGEHKKQANNVVKKIRKHIFEKNNLNLYLKETQKIFMESFQKIYRIPFDTIFDKTLGIGVSVIKTSECCRISTYTFKEHLRKCPVCSSQISRFANKIPMVHQNSSSLICRINGSLMDETNYPIALPSGQIYSRTGLHSLVKNGKYYCPISQKWFKKSESRKVFLT